MRSVWSQTTWIHPESQYPVRRNSLWNLQKFRHVPHSWVQEGNDWWITLVWLIDFNRFFFGVIFFFSFSLVRWNWLKFRHFPYCWRFILIGLIDFIWFLVMFFSSGIFTETGILPHCSVHSYAPSIWSHRGTKVVWPDFQPMRESPRRTGLRSSLSAKSSFSSLHFKVAPPL